MYDSYPIHDVPQQNLVQRFFSQRWSAILMEIAMTVVITFAAGAAFDFFDPFDGAQESRAAAASIEANAPAIDQLSARDLLAFIKARAKDYLRQSRFAAADALFGWAIAVAPEDAEGYAWRGYVKMRAGEYDAAQEDYRKLLELRPRAFDGHNALCWAYGETEDFELATSHCQAALEAAVNRGEFANALENWCWLQVEMGRYEDAADDCRLVLAEFSDNLELRALAHYNLGRALAGRGETRQALPHFAAALRIGSTYAKMYLEIGEFYATLGHNEAARTSLAQFQRMTGAFSVEKTQG